MSSKKFSNTGRERCSSSALQTIGNKLSRHGQAGETRMDQNAQARTLASLARASMLQVGSTTEDLEPDEFNRPVIKADDDYIVQISR